MLVVALETVEKEIIKYVDSQLAFRFLKACWIHKTLKDGNKY